MSTLISDLIHHLENNPKIDKLLWLALAEAPEMVDLPTINDTFIGDWDQADYGQRVTITWDPPYRLEYGYLFSLPGLGTNFIESALVHIPHTEHDYNEGTYFTLKHLACVATTIELEPLL